MYKKFLGLTTTASLLVAIVSFFPPVAPQAEAYTGADFNAGFIISDANFFNGSAMNGNQVQTFLEQNAPNCTINNGDPARAAGAAYFSTSIATDCPKTYRQQTPNMAPQAGFCSAYEGSSSERFADIVAKVGAACNISQKVLLVLLEKEQSLISDSWPTVRQYTSATGYACYDNGQPCVQSYGGFFYQVWAAARQFQRYGTGDLNWIPIGVPTTRPYQAANTNPNCGSKTLTIQNRATAALYYYTPYTPNAAALNNLYGTGDSCSAYGNRNFWRMYWDWFGSPTGGDSSPIGDINSITRSGSSAVVRGWAIDTDTTDSILVDAWVNGRFVTSLVANQSRPDVAQHYPTSGPNHGYVGSIPLNSGENNICLFAINVMGGTHTQLGCRSIYVGSSNPQGDINGFSVSGVSATMRGWAFDADTTDSIVVDFWVNGRFATSINANQSRPDVKAVFPAQSASHGFSATLSLSPGDNNVCVYGINVAGGSHTLLGCRSAYVGSNSPRGDINGLHATGNIANFRGWAFDADTTNSILVDVWVNGRFEKTISADESRPDVQAYFPAQSSNHGFSGSVPLQTGENNICLYGINIEGGSHTQLGCRSIAVVPSSPQGDINYVTGQGTSAAVRGWAFDADTIDSILVDAWVNGRFVATLSANQSRPDVKVYFPAQSTYHGFTGNVPLVVGKNNVCLYGINVQGGSHTLLGCRQVTR